MDIIQWIEWAISMIGGLLGLTKTALETKKLLEEKAMPDIKVADKVEEIQRNLELGKNIIALAWVETVYNTARGLVLALLFGLIAHYTLKFGEFIRPRSKDKTS